jgi:hypothetical protein
MNSRLRATGITVLAAAAAGAALALLLRDQINRRQRDLFSPSPLRRLAALGHMARTEATIDNVNLLKDFIAWEPKAMLRRRARVIAQRMEDSAVPTELAELDGDSG